MKRRLLVVLTGIDGSGKTTQAERLTNSLESDGIDVSYVWSRWKPLLLRPLIKSWKKETVMKSNKGFEHDRIKSRKQKLLRNPFIRWMWLVCFFIDYGLQIFVKIRLKMIRGGLIISDRIFYDSVIDQSVNLGDNKGWLINSLDSFWIKILFPAPDMVIFVDCPEDVAFARKDDAPNIEYLEERRKLYLELAGLYGWIIVNGTLPIDELAHQIKDEVYKRLDL